MEDKATPTQQGNDAPITTEVKGNADAFNTTMDEVNRLVAERLQKEQDAKDAEERRKKTKMEEELRTRRNEFSNMRARHYTGYLKNLKAVPMKHIRPELDNGGKLILPMQALQTIADMNLAFPIFFELANLKGDKKTVCGVIQWDAEPGSVYVPSWMLKALGVGFGEDIKCATRVLPKGNYVRFKPCSLDFLQIASPTAVLEHVLRGYAAIMLGDKIPISYNNKEYFLEVIEVKPENPYNAIAIVNVDVNCDFDAPDGMPDYGNNLSQSLDSIGRLNLSDSKWGEESGDYDSEDEWEAKKFTAFTGDGKALAASQGDSALTKALKSANQPAVAVQASTDDKQEKAGFVPFGGTGHTLK
mmetsp:Transcript_16782/g.18677  ORF Transcript_16782/g.18677 Transcript_16782/m.18677 type:complete len:358 (+) Transcript_16782:68-1141(+)